MWADSKTLSFLKVGSMVQKLFDVEKLHMRQYRHKNNVKNGAFAYFKHQITFEPLIQFSKTKVFWNLPTLGQNFLIFNSVIYLCNFNHSPFNRYKKKPWH